MTAIDLYYNEDCADCARLARWTARFDWFGRVNLRTDESPIGPVPKGEIVVVDRRSGETFTGIYATRKVSLQVPAYFLYGLLLYVPPIRRLAAGSKPGCNGDACEV